MGFIVHYRYLRIRGAMIANVFYFSVAEYSGINLPFYMMVKGTSRPTPYRGIRSDSELGR